MNKRKLSLGERNISGKRVTEARKLKKMSQVELLAKMQVMGVEISIPALSLLEGQKRPVNDIEHKAISKILGVSIDWLTDNENTTC